MTSKLGFIAFVPFTIAAVFFKLVPFFFMPAQDGTILFGLTALQLDYISLGCVVLVFLFSLILALCDRKIAPYYISERNIPAGIFSVILGVLFGADAAYSAIELLGQGEIKVLNVVALVLCAVSAVIMVVLGLTHFVRKTEARKLALLYLFPAFLFAVRLVASFVSITTVSVIYANIGELALYVFATMFWFNYTVMLSVTEAKNAVKSCFIYGFPAMAAAVCYGVKELLENFQMTDLMKSLPAYEALTLALVILSVLIELCIKAKKRDQVVIKGLRKNREAEEEEERKKSKDNENVDGFVVSKKIENKEELSPSSYYSNTDTTDYLYRDTQANAKSKKKPLSHEESPDGYAVLKSEDVVYQKEEKGANETPYTSRMDEIDKLILEISEEDK